MKRQLEQCTKKLQELLYKTGHQIFHNFHSQSYHELVLHKPCLHICCQIHICRVRHERNLLRCGKLSCLGLRIVQIQHRNQLEQLGARLSYRMRKPFHIHHPERESKLYFLLIITHTKQVFNLTTISNLVKYFFTYTFILPLTLTNFLKLPRKFYIKF